MKLENQNLKQKLNDVSTNAINVKKENELLLKKNVDLERTCTAIQKELTNSLQKANATENRIIRLNVKFNEFTAFMTQYN